MYCTYIQYCMHTATSFSISTVSHTTAGQHLQYPTVRTYRTTAVRTVPTVLLQYLQYYQLLLPVQYHSFSTIPHSATYRMSTIQLRFISRDNMAALVQIVDRRWKPSQLRLLNLLLIRVHSETLHRILRRQYLADFRERRFGASATYQKIEPGFALFMIIVLGR